MLLTARIHKTPARHALRATPMRRQVLLSCPHALSSNDTEQTAMAWAGHAHHDNHVHFRCTACQHTHYPNQVAILPVVLPAGLRIEHRSYLISGVCGRCRSAA